MSSVDGIGRSIERVASWAADAETIYPVDLRLVHNSFVTMCWKPSLLDDTVGWLRSHEYRVVEFDAASWSSGAGVMAGLR